LTVVNADNGYRTNTDSGVAFKRRGRVVANAVALYVTIDHQVIVAWAERRGARPSTFEGDEHPWPLLFTFGEAGVGVREISWDGFFAEFERADLAFIYRDAGPDGELDDFHEFVKRAAVVKLLASGKSTVVDQEL
jgi:hypothetical protein